MHIDDEVVHLLELMGTSGDNKTYAFIDGLQIAVRHDASDFDNDMPIRFQPRHFEVNPYQLVAVCHKVSVTAAAHDETGVPLMESLALLVSVILMVTVSLGPISIVLSRFQAPMARLFGFVTGGLGVAAGVLLLLSVDSRGGAIIGILAAALSALGIFLNLKKPTY